MVTAPRWIPILPPNIFTRRQSFSSKALSGRTGEGSFSARSVPQSYTKIRRCPSPERGESRGPRWPSTVKELRVGLPLTHERYHMHRWAMRFLIAVGVWNFLGASAYLAGVDRRRHASDVKPKLRITPVISPFRDIKFALPRFPETALPFNRGFPFRPR